MTTELQQVLNSIAQLKTDVDNRIDKLDTKIDSFNTKFDYYQQATQWVIVLAFSLILAATAITIFSSVFAFR
jgi:hypothetical protein